jgi:hypothetical protein
MTKKHVLIMLACCLIPLGFVAAIMIFKVPVNNALLFLMVLLCPLGHVLMMGKMGHEGHVHQSTSDKTPTPKELGER